MNETEKIMFKKYEDVGYDVIHSGVPDFILLKDNEIKFREVKRQNDSLLETQKRAIKLLQEHGFEVKVDTVYFPDISNKIFERLSPKRSPVETYWHNFEIYKRMLTIEPFYPKVS